MCIEKASRHASESVSQSDRQEVSGGISDHIRALGLNNLDINLLYPTDLTLTLFFRYNIVSL